MNQQLIYNEEIKSYDLHNIKKNRKKTQKEFLRNNE